MIKSFLKFAFRKKRRPNQRRFRRLKAHFLVNYQVDKNGQATITNARDISAGGAKFWASEAPSPGSTLKVSIDVPPLDRTVEAVAKVCRVRRIKQGLLFNVAVTFLDLKKEDREAINEFAETLAKDKNARFLIDHADIVVRGAERE